MRRFSSVLAGAAVLLLAGAAQASGNPVLDHADSYCISTRGDAASALAKAEADGWTPPPPEMNDILSPMLGPKGQARIKVEGDKVYMLFAAHAAPAFAELGPDNDLCAVLYNDAAMDPIAEARRRFGAEPSFTADVFQVWGLNTTTMKPVGVLNDETAESGFKADKLFLLMAGTSDGMAEVLFLKHAAP